MIYHCCDQLRRNQVAAHSPLNGIDYLEVIDHDLPEDDPLRQRTLLLRLLKPITGLSAKNLKLTGGERIRNLRIEWAEVATPTPQQVSRPDEAGPAAVIALLPYPKNVLVIRTDATGDFSTYRLQLVRAPDDSRPPKDFDPRLVEVAFSFKVECPNGFDCKTEQVCPEEARDIPDINYLAKDYASFRRLILDRLTHLVPDWRERSAADLGVTLAELLAYVGDHLSYAQDAVATEAYLETARRRTSLRRHALLVDYHMHNGCNARVWLQLQVSAYEMSLPKQGTRFYTRIPGLPPRIVPDSRSDREALQQSPTVFEPMHESTLFEAHNEIRIYTWFDRNCCLLKGATRATLVGHLPNLIVKKDEKDETPPFNLLLLEEKRGPITGSISDADPTRRHIVRLTSVDCFSIDDRSKPLTDPLTGVCITEVTWAKEDALPFPLCVSATTDEKHDSKFIEDVSVAHGNVVLCDHGMTLSDKEPLGIVPASVLGYRHAASNSRCLPLKPDPVHPRFNPKLAKGPLTFAGRVEKVTRASGDVEKREWKPFDSEKPASDAMRWREQDAIANLTLESVLGSPPEKWISVRDLLNSEASDHHCVAEVENDGATSLRFGNDQFGKRPEAGSVFTASYRVGNGRAGNVGAKTVAHVVSTVDGITGVRNPLAARGGLEPESAAEVQRRAPQAFRRQERAVTPADYAEVTTRSPGVQRAAASLRWTGSWHTAFITVDRDGGVLLDDEFESDLTRHVERYRMAGQDVEFNDPIYVSLAIDLLVCVKPDYLRSQVRKSLLDLLSNRTLPDGRRGVFHPNNLSFGQTVYLGPIYAAAHAVEGVHSVQVTRFSRQGDNKDGRPLADGFLKLGRLEIPRLDNNPNFPEHGLLELQLYGGK